MSGAVWDVWRRYSRVAGVTMGKGLAILLAHRLATEIEDMATFDHLLGDKVALHVTALRDTVEEWERRLHAARDRLKRCEASSNSFE